MAHTISEKELNEWLRQSAWKTYASSGGPDSVKRLDVDLSEHGCVCRVVVNNETVFLGADKAAAIAKYNEAP